MTRECTNCVNCDSIRGFMITCHCSYETIKDGIKYHVQEGRDCHKSYAKKCEHYSEESYERDEMFVF